MRPHSASGPAQVLRRVVGVVAAGALTWGCASSGAAPREAGYDSMATASVAAAPDRGIDCAIDVARSRGFSLVERSAAAASLRSDVREPVSGDDPLGGQPVDHLRLSLRGGQLGAGARTLVPRAVNAGGGTGTVWTVAAPSGRALETVQAIVRVCGSPAAT